MPKKRTQKSKSSPKTTRSSSKKPSSHLEETILHNLVELQKIYTHTAEKFDKISSQLNDLLGLFELAARDFANQPHVQSTEKDKDFLEKIDRLLDQNKTIAKGLTLMEEKMRERLGYNPGPPRNPREIPRY